MGLCMPDQGKGYLARQCGICPGRRPNQPGWPNAGKRANPLAYSRFAPGTAKTASQGNAAPA